MFQENSTKVLSELDNNMTRTLSLTALGEPDLFFRPHRTLFFRVEEIVSFFARQMFQENSTKAGRCFLRQPLYQNSTFFFDLTRPFFSDLKKVDQSDPSIVKQNTTRRLSDNNTSRTLSLTALGEPPSFFSTSQDLFFLRENCHFFCRLNVLSEPDNDTTRTFSVNRLIRTPIFFFDLTRPFFSQSTKLSLYLPD